MSLYQNTVSEVLPNVEVSFTVNAPQKPAAPLRRSWYSLTVSDDEEDTGISAATANAEVANSIMLSCAANLQVIDGCSDASTDVGADELEDREIVDECDGDVEPSPSKELHSVQWQRMPARPTFPKMTRQQRVDQMKRVVDEFCSLDFHVVDPSSQGGLVLRMLTILKSLSDSAIFHSEAGRCEERRLSLLGLCDEDADVIAQVVKRADHLIAGRSFHGAFDVLRELAPRLSGQMTLQMPTEPKQPMSFEELEAMKLRRLDKRQRQRGERREQRATDRSERSSRRN